ncbi:hypothetical protein [Kineococcus gypseus]|uniref:hypothetical protein n=1 Tax=Kineococcus gypseus TaxID=1637102 RepID=UPI003D7D8224
MGPELVDQRLGALAREAAGLGADLRRVGRGAAGLDALRWSGTGAAAFRARLGELVDTAAAVAGGCEEAAARLAAHRAAVATAAAAAAAVVAARAAAGAA